MKSVLARKHSTNFLKLLRDIYDSSFGKPEAVLSFGPYMVSSSPLHASFVLLVHLLECWRSQVWLVKS